MKAPEIPEEFKDTGSSVAEVENPFVGADIDEPFPEPYHDVQEITEPLTKSLFDTVDKGITDFDQIPYDVESDVSIPTPPQEVSGGIIWCAGVMFKCREPGMEPGGQ